MKKFFEELSRRLREGGVESSNVEDRRLEIFLHGQPVLFVSPGNDVFLFPAGSNNPEASELYHRVAQTADEVYTYKVSTDDLVKLKRIRKAAEQGEFDILLVFMYDRLGRNLNETPFIAEWFTKKGIHVWSVYEGEIIDGVDAERMLDYIRFWQTDEAQKL